MVFKKNKIIFLIISLISLDFLGIGGSFFPIPTPFGYQSGFHLILIALILLSLGEIRNLFLNQIWRYYGIILIIVLLWIPGNIFDVMRGHLELNNFVKNILDYYSYFVIFPILYFMKNLGTNYIIKVLKVFYLISIIFLFLDLFNVFDFEKIIIRFNPSYVSYYKLRIYSPASIIGMYLFLHSLVYKTTSRLLIRIIELTIYAAGWLSVLSRGIILVFIVLLVLYYVYFKKNIIRSLLIPSMVFVSIIFAVGAFMKETDYGKTYFLNSIDNIQHDDDNTLYFRGYLISNYFKESSLIQKIIGKGYNFTYSNFNFEYYLKYASISAPTGDNSYVNLFLLYGLAGITIILLSYIIVLSRIHTLIKSIGNKYHKTTLQADFLFIIGILLLGFVSSILSKAPFILMLSIFNAGQISGQYDKSR